MIGRGPRAGERWGTFLVQGEVARGNMGAVYRALDERTGREVALKILVVGTRRDEAGERFEREARSLARLSHPNIVAVHSYGVHDGIPFLTMDFVAGTHLQELIDRHALSVPRAADLLAQLARAMDHAHSRGVLHRDLKPANVLIGADGAPRVTDFGLAKLQDASGSLTGEGDLIGTPVYMSPEQIRGDVRAVGPASDVWALGVMLYVLLTGKLPFPGRTVEEVGQAVVHLEPQPPSEVVPDAPEALSRVCLAALRKDPRLRYRSAGELARDLEAYLQGRPVLAGRVTPAVRVRRALRFARLHAGALAAAAGLLLLAAALAAAGRYLATTRATHQASELVARAAARRSAAALAAGQAEAALAAGAAEEALTQARQAAAELAWAAACLERASRHLAGELGEASAAEAPPRAEEVSSGLVRDGVLPQLEVWIRGLRGRALAAGAPAEGGDDALADLEAAALAGDLRAVAALIELAERRGSGEVAARAAAVVARLALPEDATSLRLRAALAALGAAPPEPWARHRGAGPLARAAAHLAAAARLASGEPQAALALLPAESSEPWERLVRARALAGAGRWGALAACLDPPPAGLEQEARLLGASAALDQGRPAAALAALDGLRGEAGPRAGEARLLAAWAAQLGPGESANLAPLLEDRELPRATWWGAVRLARLRDPHATVPTPSPEPPLVGPAARARDAAALAAAAPALEAALARLALDALGLTLPPEREPPPAAETAPLIAAWERGHDPAALAGAVVLLLDLGDRLRASELLGAAPPEVLADPAVAAAARLARGRLAAEPKRAPRAPAPRGLRGGLAALTAYVHQLEAAGGEREAARRTAGSLLALAIRQAPTHFGARLARARLSLLSAGEPLLGAELAERRRRGALQDAAVACLVDPGAPEAWSVLLQALWVQDRAQFAAERARLLEPWRGTSGPTFEAHEARLLAWLDAAAPELPELHPPPDPIEAAAARLLRRLTRSELAGRARGLAVFPETPVVRLLEEQARHKAPPLERTLVRAELALEEPVALEPLLLLSGAGAGPELLRALDAEVEAGGARSGVARVARTILALQALPATAPAPERAALLERALVDLDAAAERRIGPGLLALEAVLWVWVEPRLRRSDLGELTRWEWPGTLHDLLAALAAGRRAPQAAEPLLRLEPLRSLAAR